VSPTKISILRFAWFALLFYALVLAICIAGWLAFGAPGDPSTSLVTVIIAASMPVLGGVLAAFVVLWTKDLITFGDSGTPQKKD